MQDAETEDDVERLAEAVDTEHVQAAVVDPGTQKLGDRPEPGAGHEVDVLSIQARGATAVSTVDSDATRSSSR